jgi:hypothetical protein
MRRIVLLLSLVAPLLLLAGPGSAQERHAPSSRAARAARRVAAAPKPVETPPAPVISGDAGWAGGVLIGFGALVLAGVVVGPLYRVLMPGVLVPMHSHDEPPGSSHRHGPGGERARPAED